MDDFKLFGTMKAELDSWLQSTKEFNKDIGMQFGTDKCETVAIKTGTIFEDDEIQLDNKDLIKAVASEKGYKYVGVL